MDAALIAQTEKTIANTLYNVLASKKTQTWVLGSVTTLLTWVVAFAFLHLGDKWGLQPAMLALVPIAAGVMSTAIISGMSVTLHALGKQDDGKEAAAITAQSAKDAAGLGLHDFLIHVEQEAPGMIKKFLDAQEDNANLPPALKLAAIFLKPSAPVPSATPT